MVSDKVIKIEILISILFIFFLTIGCMGATYANFLAVDEGKENTISLGDLAITYCNDVNCNSTYENIGQVIGTKAENGVSTPNYIYPYENDSEALNTTPYIFKVENTGSLDSTVKIKLKEDATFTPSGDYSDYARLTSKYASHLKVAIRKKVLYDDTGYQLGDVNMDGIINLKDVNLIINSLSGIVTLTDEQKILADFNEDGEISYLDALGLNDTLTGSETKHENSIIYIYTYTDLEDGVIFKDDIIKSGESAIYFLWLYLDDTTPNDAQKTYFVGNIDVDGEFIPKVNPVSFATDSWEIIVTAVKENNISKYNVGDTRKNRYGRLWNTYASYSKYINSK